MPATAQRIENDHYRTPTWAVERFLHAWAPTIAAPSLILEPAAAGRALLPPLRQAWPNATICPRDLALQPGDEGVVEQRNFWLDDTPESFDLVITNPPYVFAETFVRQGLTKVRRGGHLALLLRCTFIGSAERIPLFKSLKPYQGWVLPERPAFRREGTDSAPSVWFVWKNDGRRRLYTELRWL